VVTTLLLALILAAPALRTLDLLAAIKG
jgi:hypothetical protein